MGWKIIRISFEEVDEPGLSQVFLTMTLNTLGKGKWFS
jgi:hypothetical protein